MSDDQQIDVHLLWQELGVMHNPVCDDARTVIERLTAEVAALKHDIARHMQIANDAEEEATRWKREQKAATDIRIAAEAEAARLREKLQDCVDAYDFVIVDEQDRGWSSVSDAIHAARAALRGEEGCPPPPPQGSEG